MRVVYEKLHENLYNIIKLMPSQVLTSNEDMENKTFDEIKKVLLWTSLFDDSTWDKNLGAAQFKHCKYSSCELLNDKTQLSNSDALLFHIRDIGELPFNHSYNQIWIFYMMESPILTCSNSPNISYHLDKYDYIFNWTITYLPQSDIYRPYYDTLKIEFKKVESNHSSNYKMYSMGKKGLAISIMSNCHAHNNRHKYIEEIRNHISSIQDKNNGRAPTLEVHGKCSSNGSLICDYVGPMKEVCLRKFISSYKFYLAFENANCAHYITEKMFRALYAGAVPVVFGARYSEYSRIAPPFSFIYVASPLAMKMNGDFGNQSQKDSSTRNVSQEIPKNHPYFHSNNMEELAKYLLELDSNATLYSEYHTWRKEYESPILTCSNEPELPYQLDKYDYVFNWTITYLPQSDIYKPYYAYLGIDIKKSTHKHSVNYKVYSKNKKKLAISVMSNCASFNHRLGNNTRPARSLEVHGRCSKQFSGNGFRICNYNGPMKEKEVCLRNFISSYKFYLAFENANCEHYITEKMFRALYAGAIPVVFGARYSDYVKIAPPFSFIYIASPLAMKTNEVVGNISSQKDPSIRDINQEVPKNHPYFHSNNLEELANYLLKLDSDDKLNDKYHAWRKEYEIVPRPDDEYLCQICQHLHLKDIPNKSYKISDWWNREKACNPY
ncbi:unnamed protein product [Gordionus sp. m RMFG-2023]